MRAFMMMSIVALSAVLVAGSAQAQDCEVTCQQECKQEKTQCEAEVSFGARAAKFACETEATEVRFDCEADAIDSRSDCVGMCGIDVRECLAAAKAMIKECKGTAKLSMTECMAEVDAAEDEESQMCATDFTDCMDFCSDDF